MLFIFTKNSIQDDILFDKGKIKKSFPNLLTAGAFAKPRKSLLSKRILYHCKSAAGTCFYAKYVSSLKAYDGFQI